MRPNIIPETISDNDLKLILLAAESFIAMGYSVSWEVDSQTLLQKINLLNEALNEA